MAFLPLFSGRAFPRGTYYDTITLMSYINKADKPNEYPARKYCYIVKCNALREIFAAAGVTLADARGIRNSYWNRRHPVKGQEYGVEICEDDNGNPGDFHPPVYLVYRNHWKYRNAEAQYQIYSAAITPEQASALDGQLRAHDISAHPAPAKEPAPPKAILIKQ